jgi:DUF917 family protein
MEEIESLAIGAWILGTGGGGSPYLALLNMRQLYRKGVVCRLMDPSELADDDLVAVCSSMGAPLVGQARLTNPKTMALAVTMMEEYLGRRPSCSAVTCSPSRTWRWPPASSTSATARGWRRCPLRW